MQTCLGPVVPVIDSGRASLIRAAPRSPAEKAGLQKGDIVKAVDGTAIRSAAQLRNLIGLAPLGSRVELRFERDGAAYSTAVEVGPVKAAPPKRAGQ